MALGGGTFLVQNKKLPGAYMNFISKAVASATLSDRGYAALGIDFGWGAEGEIFTVTSGDFIKDARKIFGYSYDDDAVKGIRELFRTAQTGYFYRLDGGGTKASNTFATALYGGTRGNDLKTVIAKDVDDDTKFVVSTYLGTALVDSQIVAEAKDLEANDFCKFKADAELAVTAGLALSGGTNATVTGDSHSTFLGLSEAYSYNAIAYIGTEATIKSLYVAFTKRMRDEVGKKFQCVLYNSAADYEGVVNVKNKVTDGKTDADLVYWTLGVVAGTAVNASATNKKYDGEYSVDTSYTQSQLEAAIDAGEFVFHKVDDDVRVLTDINSLVTTTDEKGDVFKANQTIRVIDQIANDIAVVFNTKYLGVVPNDKGGRASLWGDIVAHHKQLQDIRAIEDFDTDNVTVEQGNTKKAVVVTDSISVVNAMEQLYMTVVVA